MTLILRLRPNACESDTLTAAGIGREFAHTYPDRVGRLHGCGYIIDRHLKLYAYRTRTGSVVVRQEPE